MPHPFSPEDFPIDRDFDLRVTKVFYLRQAIHFKQTAGIAELTGRLRRAFPGDFSGAWADEAAATAHELLGLDGGGGGKPRPRYEIGSCGEMMRTIKTMTDGRTGERVCDLNITFVSIDTSRVRFPAGSPHSRHDVEVAPVDEAAARGAAAAAAGGRTHECFIRHSVPYFWDMTGGSTGGVLYKCMNQRRCEVGRVAPTASARTSSSCSTATRSTRSSRWPPPSSC